LFFLKHGLAGIIALAVLDFALDVALAILLLRLTFAQGFIFTVCFTAVLGIYSTVFQDQIMRSARRARVSSWGSYPRLFGINGIYVLMPETEARERLSGMNCDTPVSWRIVCSITEAKIGNSLVVRADELRVLTLGKRDAPNFNDLQRLRDILGKKDGLGGALGALAENPQSGEDDSSEREVVAVFLVIRGLVPQAGGRIPEAETIKEYLARVTGPPREVVEQPPRTMTHYCFAPHSIGPTAQLIETRFASEATVELRLFFGVC
jgi:hypothetical protein